MRGSRTVSRQLLRNGGIFLDIFMPLGSSGVWGEEGQRKGFKHFEGPAALSGFSLNISSSPAPHSQIPHLSAKLINSSGCEVTGTTLKNKKAGEGSGSSHRCLAVTLTIYFRGSKGRIVAMTAVLPFTVFLSVISLKTDTVFKDGPPLVKVSRGAGEGVDTWADG